MTTPEESYVERGEFPERDVPVTPRESFRGNPNEDAGKEYDIPRHVERGLGVPDLFVIDQGELGHSHQDPEFARAEIGGYGKALAYFDAMSDPAHLSNYRETMDRYLPVYQGDEGRLRIIAGRETEFQRHIKEKSLRDFQDNREHGTMATVAETLFLALNHIPVFGEGIVVDARKTAKQEDEYLPFADIAVGIDFSAARKEILEDPQHPLKAYMETLHGAPRYFLVDVTTNPNGAKKKVGDRARNMGNNGDAFDDLYFYWRKKPSFSGSSPRLTELGLKEPPRFILETRPEGIIDFLKKVQPNIEWKGNTEVIGNFKKFKEHYVDFFGAAAERLRTDCELLLEQTLIHAEEQKAVLKGTVETFSPLIHDREKVIELYRKISGLQWSEKNSVRERTVKKLADTVVIFDFLEKHRALKEGREKH